MSQSGANLAADNPLPETAERGAHAHDAGSNAIEPDLPPGGPTAGERDAARATRAPREAPPAQAGSLMQGVPVVQPARPTPSVAQKKTDMHKGIDEMWAQWERMNADIELFKQKEEQLRAARQEKENARDRLKKKLDTVWQWLREI
jgi:hypothetical protein